MKLADIFHRHQLDRDLRAYNAHIKKNNRFIGLSGADGTDAISKDNHYLFKKLSIGKKTRENRERFRAGRYHEIINKKNMEGEFLFAADVQSDTGKISDKRRKFYRSAILHIEEIHNDLKFNSEKIDPEQLKKTIMKNLTSNGDGNLAVGLEGQENLPNAGGSDISKADDRVGENAEYKPKPLASHPPGEFAKRPEEMKIGSLDALVVPAMPMSPGQVPFSSMEDDGEHTGYTPPSDPENGSPSPIIQIARTVENSKLKKGMVVDVEPKTRQLRRATRSIASRQLPENPENSDHSASSGGKVRQVPDIRAGLGHQIHEAWWAADGQDTSNEILAPETELAAPGDPSSREGTKLDVVDEGRKPHLADGFSRYLEQRRRNSSGANPFFGGRIDRK